MCDNPLLQTVECLGEHPIVESTRIAQSLINLLGHLQASYCWRELLYADYRFLPGLQEQHKVPDHRCSIQTAIYPTKTL
jgi:hypothetical protein